MRTSIALSLLSISLVATLSAATPVKSLSDLHPTPADTAGATVQPKIIAGDPTSSLSHARALELAQSLAANIPGAGVADLDQAYNGQFSPAIPANTVYVVEPADFAGLRAFDLILFKDPSGKLRARMLLAKAEDRAIVGFTFKDANSTAEIEPRACVGRIVASIHFNPNAK